jgi:hypothetical protein
MARCGARNTTPPYHLCRNRVAREGARCPKHPGMPRAGPRRHCCIERRPVILTGDLPARATSSVLRVRLRSPPEPRRSPQTRLADPLTEDLTVKITRERPMQQCPLTYPPTETAVDPHRSSRCASRRSHMCRGQVGEGAGDRQAVRSAGTAEPRLHIRHLLRLHGVPLTLHGTYDLRLRSWRSTPVPLRLAVAPIACPGAYLHPG